MKKLNDTTWKRIEKDDDRDRVETIIGDDKQPDFKPQVKVQRWDNEHNISIRLKKNKIKSEIIEYEDRVELKDEKHKARFYPLKQDDREELQDDAFEFDVILKEKPNTNKLEFSVRSKGVKLYYQPPLTEQKDEFPEADKVTETKAIKEVEVDERVELEDGTVLKEEDTYERVIAKRPEHIVNSYAVYTSEDKQNIEGGKKYRTGKIGHIHRPKIIDNQGNEVWGDLNYSNGILTVEIPQDFLDSASYPVRVDPTFGYETVGGSESSSICTASAGLTSLGYDPTGSHFSVNDPFNIDSINVYFAPFSSTYGNASAKTALANYSDESLLEVSESLFTSRDNWIEFTFSNPDSYSSSEYWLLVVGDGETVDSFGGAGPTIRYDTGESGKGTHTEHADGYYFHDPVYITTNSRKYSIYATYTIPNEPPNAPSNPIPVDGDNFVSSSVDLQVDVSDPDGDSMDVSFYDDSDDSLIGTDSGVSDGGTASVTWSGLTRGNTYNWYAVADDGSATTQSSTWSFTTNAKPDAPSNPIPVDGDNFIPSSVDLQVDVSDPDGDSMDVSFYDASDDSQIGSTQTGVSDGGTASVTWSGLTYGVSNSWYAIADDSSATTQSSTYSFTVTPLTIDGEDVVGITIDGDTVADLSIDGTVIS